MGKRTASASKSKTLPVDTINPDQSFEAFLADAQEIAWRSSTLCDALRMLLQPNGGAPSMPAKRILEVMRIDTITLFERLEWFAEQVLEDPEGFHRRALDSLRPQRKP